jgi:hypothetical protein
MNDRPLVSYEPNPLLAWVYQRFFESIEVDEAWAHAVRDADARGTVVYVLRNLSVIDFLALDYLTKRHNLPRIQFANDLGLWILEPMGRGWLNALRARSPERDATDLERAVTSGASAALFLKRPPHLLEASARGKIEGDRLIRALFDVERRTGSRVLLVPQVFVWSRSPGTRGGNAIHRPISCQLAARDAAGGRSRRPGRFPVEGGYEHRRRSSRATPHLHASPPPRAGTARDRGADPEAGGPTARRGHP